MPRFLTALPVYNEAGHVAAVLDGDLDTFMEGFLQWKRSGAAAAGE